MLSGGKALISVDSIPKLVEPIGIQIDINRLQSEVLEIYQARKFSELKAYETTTRQVTFNFNHPKVIPAGVENIHFGALATGEDLLKSRFNMTTSDFTEMDPMVIGTYLEDVYNQIQDWHKKNCSELGTLTRMQCTVLANGAGYQMHVDHHTTIRYHIALRTNEYSYMLCQDNENIKVVHIPADGRIWLLDTRAMHTALNLAPNRIDRLERLRSHIILSVS